MTINERVEVTFLLTADERGWPPVRAEHVWAVPLGTDTYRIDNSPFFVRNIAVGDVVRAAPSPSEVGPVFVERLTWSGNHTIRVMAMRNGDLSDDDVPQVVAAFAARGIHGEVLGVYPMVSLCIPMDAELAALKAALDEGQAAGRWAWEEGCVGEVWLDL